MHAPTSMVQMFVRWIIAFAILVAVFFILSIAANGIANCGGLPTMIHAMIFGGYNVASR